MKKPEHYIVIDDDNTNNLICEFLIKKFDPDAGVLSFNIPELAIDHIVKCANNDFIGRRNILFIDLNMPTMSGYELIDELFKFRADIMEHFEIFILTSSIEDFSEKKEQYPNISRFLSKPLSRNYLEQIARGAEKEKFFDR